LKKYLGYDKIFLTNAAASSVSEVFMDGIDLKAYAKINLHLDVLGIAENRYHKVDTVMQTVSLCDDVTVALSEGESHSISCNIESIPKDRKNLAWRAADIFFERIGEKRAADIKIFKRIPVAAGLAGGSTDAAAVFRGLNRLCGEPMTLSELCELGAALGADVPFCIVGGTLFADRYGDLLHPIAEMPSCHMVVACGKEGVSTPWAYSTLDSCFGGFAEGAYSPKDLSPLRRALEDGDILSVAENIYNIFERAIEPEREEVTAIKEVMLARGAYNAMMSGSGPSVFGIFPDEKTAKLAEDELKTQGVAAFYCNPVKNQI